MIDRRAALSVSSSTTRWPSSRYVGGASTNGCSIPPSTVSASATTVLRSRCATICAAAAAAPARPICTSPHAEPRNDFRTSPDVKLVESPAGALACAGFGNERPAHYRMLGLATWVIDGRWQTQPQGRQANLRTLWLLTPKWQSQARRGYGKKRPIKFNQLLKVVSGGPPQRAIRQGIATRGYVKIALSGLRSSYCRSRRRRFFVCRACASFCSRSLSS
jgi:hypothetical protein